MTPGFQANTVGAPMFGQAFPPSVGMLGTGLGMSSMMGNPYQQFMQATSPQMGQGQSFAGNFMPSTMTPPGLGSLSGAPLNATQMMEQLNTSSPAGEQPSVKSAFELLGRTPVTAPPVQQDSNEVMLRALAAALSGDKKSLPQWNGNVESLRPWLRSLSLWELDNHLPKQRWGLKLLQSFPEGSVPRKVAEALDLTVLSSDHGYSAILSAILTKYGPYLEAAGPAAVENFFYGSERNRSESLATYIAAKEIALAELESQVGEKVPPRIAGRILLRHANLSETQKEALAIKYNSLLPFEQMAAALRPLDRPEALVHRVAKTFLAAGSKDDEEAAEEVDYEDEELVPDEDWEEGPESDGEGGMNYLLFDTHQEYTEEEANYIWAYNSAYKDIRKELQARRKGRQFYKPKGRSVAKGSGKKGKHKSRKGKPSAGNRGTPEDLMARTKCFSCGELGHMSKECPQKNRTSFFVCRGTQLEQSRTYVVGVESPIPSAHVVENADDAAQIAQHNRHLDVPKPGVSDTPGLSSGVGPSQAGQNADDAAQIAQYNRHLDVLKPGVSDTPGLSSGVGPSKAGPGTLSIEQSCLEQSCIEQSCIEQSCIEQSCIDKSCVEQSNIVQQSSIEQHSIVQPSSIEQRNIEQQCIGRAECWTGAAPPEVNSVLVNVSSEVQKCVQIFAGVKTEGTEAIVDTAAEEGVIGSNAMRRLREALSRFKLQPVEASGSTVSCAGIGGSARIVGIFDIPIGVARCNSLIRVTEIADEGNFETPFLLPISYIELVGGVVDTGRNIFTLKNGRRTPMRRTPSGHRAISVVEFSGQWKLPPQLADELGAKDRNPFHMDIAGERNRVQQRPGVAVWVKEGQVVTFVGTLPGPRDTLVHPSECLSPAELPHISGRRVTHAVFDDDIASNIHDLWTGQQRQFPFWSGDVVFERFERFSPPVDVADTPHPPLEPQDGVQVRPASGEATATASHRTAPEVGDLEKELCFQSLQGDGALSSSQRKSKCEYFDLSHPLSAPNSSSRLQICVSAQARDDQVQTFASRHAQPPGSMAQSGRSRRTQSASEDGIQAPDGSLAQDGIDDFESHRDLHPKVSHGVPHAAQHHSAQVSRGCEGEAQELQEDRRWKDSPWHRAGVETVKRLQDLAFRAPRLCPRRRSAQAASRPWSALVDLPGMWVTMGALGMGRRQGFQHGSPIIHGSTTDNSRSVQALQGGLPEDAPGPQALPGHSSPPAGGDHRIASQALQPEAIQAEPRPHSSGLPDSRRALGRNAEESHGPKGSHECSAHEPVADSSWCNTPHSLKRCSRDPRDAEASNTKDLGQGGSSCHPFVGRGSEVEWGQLLFSDLPMKAEDTTATENPVQQGSKSHESPTILEGPLPSRNPFEGIFSPVPPPAHDATQSLSAGKDVKQPTKKPMKMQGTGAKAAMMACAVILCVMPAVSTGSALGWSLRTMLASRPLVLLTCSLQAPLSLEGLILMESQGS